MNAADQKPEPGTGAPTPFAQTFFHGTKATLRMGELIEVGYRSNFETDKSLRHVYMTATLDAAIWGAELAGGNGPASIYLVEATGPLEDDPNVTDKRFPGNPTKSYRSLQPLRVVGILASWQAHAPEQVQAMKEGLAKLAAKGLDKIED